MNPTTALPRTDVYYVEETQGEVIVEFRLIYSGPLPSESSRPHPKLKHDIRKVFHRQLVELWKQTPCLVLQSTQAIILSEKEPIWGERHALVDPKGKPWVEHLANQYARCGFRFVPLVRKESPLSCSLDILFLRYDPPGTVINQGGDIDNRLKVLFDSFRLVDQLNELGGAVPESGEDPFFVLLEDDRMITELTVTTDRLLESFSDPQHVHLVIRVRLTDPSALFSQGRLV